MEINSTKEITQVREFLRSLPLSEQHRLLQLFTEGMEAQAPIFQVDWSDKTPDGTIKTPEAKEAASGTSSGL